MADNIQMLIVQHRERHVNTMEQVTQSGHGSNTSIRTLITEATAMSLERALASLALKPVAVLLYQKVNAKHENLKDVRHRLVVLEIPTIGVEVGRAPIMVEVYISAMYLAQTC